MTTTSHFFDVAAGLYDLWRYDGEAPPVQLCDDETYVISPGPCPAPVRSRPAMRGLVSTVEP